MSLFLRRLVDRHFSDQPVVRARKQNLFWKHQPMQLPRAHEVIVEQVGGEHKVANHTQQEPALRPVQQPNLVEPTVMPPPTDRVEFQPEPGVYPAGSSRNTATLKSEKRVMKQAVFAEHNFKVAEPNPTAQPLPLAKNTLANTNQVVFNGNQQAKKHAVVQPRKAEAAGVPKRAIAPLINKRPTNSVAVTPTVKIHIGRIDVRAPSKTTKPTPKSPSKPQPRLSLDQFLNQSD